MRRSVKVLGLAAVAGGLVIPPIAAAIAKGRMEIVDDPDAPEVMLATIFDGEDLANRSPEFRGGTTVCWYGGQRLDLRGATLAPEGATLKVRCLFGGLQVLVPATWRVQVTGHPDLRRDPGRVLRPGRRGSAPADRGDRRVQRDGGRDGGRRRPHGRRGLIPPGAPAIGRRTAGSSATGTFAGRGVPPAPTAPAAPPSSRPRSARGRGHAWTVGPGRGGDAGGLTLPPGEVKGRPSELVRSILGASRLSL